MAKKNSHLTAEHKAKISAALRNFNASGCKRPEWSKEQREQIRQRSVELNTIAYLQTPEAQAKMMASRVGTSPSNKKHPLTYKDQRQYLCDYARWKTYGITPEQYAALRDKQNGLCAICQKDDGKIDSRTGKPHALRVDHDHRTNEIRGLLCINCNKALERLDNIPDWADRAQAYLNLLEPEYGLSGC